MDTFESIMQIVERARPFGFRQLASGVKLYGHMPHIAPEAWLHYVFPPLVDEDILAMEQKIGQAIPNELRKFFRVANGIGLFSDSLSVYGRRSSYSRSGDDVWQPFCIVTANTIDRPTHAKPDQIVIGSYQDDGSLVFIDSRDGTVFRTKVRSKKLLNRWSDFWSMLTTEATRMGGLFDSTGHRVDDGPTTPTPSD